jgi:hypothetical protein
MITSCLRGTKRKRAGGSQYPVVPTLLTYAHNICHRIMVLSVGLILSSLVSAAKNCVVLTILHNVLEVIKICFTGRCLERPIFQGLSQEVLSACLESVQSAAQGGRSILCLSLSIEKGRAVLYRDLITILRLASMQYRYITKLSRSPLPQNIK